MQIAEEQVCQIARLARIQLSSSEPAHYSRELTEIIEYFDRLAEVDTDIIEIAPRFASGNELREDIARESLSTEEALKNAPEKKDNYFIVPRVI